jgi:hypothetical protein
METLIHADIFFYITTIAVIIVTVFIAIILFYAVKVARKVDSIATTVEQESKNVVGDIDAIRSKVREEGAKFTGFSSFVGRFLLGKYFGSNKEHKRKNGKTSHHGE